MGIYFFLIIIIIIIVLDCYNNNITNYNNITKSNNITNYNNITKSNNINDINDINNIKIHNKPTNKIKNKIINIIPWSQIINDNQINVYCIKISVPSLQDYEKWKNIINGLNFNPTTSEIMIPSDDEFYALVIAYYMNLNFSGQILFDNIIQNDLLNIKLDEIKNNENKEIEIREHIININKSNELNNTNNNNPTNNNTFESYDNNDSGTYFSYI